MRKGAAFVLRENGNFFALSTGPGASPSEKLVCGADRHVPANQTAWWRSCRRKVDTRFHAVFSSGGGGPQHC